MRFLQQKMCCLSLKAGCITTGAVEILFCLLTSIIVISMVMKNEFDMYDGLPILMAGVKLISSISLIYGSVKESRFFILLWLLLAAVSAHLKFLDVFLSPFGGIIEMGIFVFGILPIKIYLCLCVFSYYVELSQNKYKENSTEEYSLV